MDVKTRQLIEVMKTKLEEQEAFLTQLSEQPSPYAVVLQVYPEHKRAMVASGRTVMQVALPSKPIQVGSYVTLASTGQIIDVVPDYIPSGPVATVERLLSADTCEVTFNSSKVIVLRGAFRDDARPLAIGDHVILDNSLMLIADLLPPPTARETVERVNVAWDAVGGLKTAKEALDETILQPYQYPELYSHYRMSAPNGALLFGPPGNGKTLLAKAIATRLSGGTNGIFLSIKGPEVLNKYVGETEHTIREKFAMGRRFHAETGKPSVLFVDEADALLSKRGSASHTTIGQTVVPTFLAEMDGSVFVILATNRPDVLDEAVVRDGRIDRKIEIGRPSAEDAREVLSIHIGDAPIGDTTKDALIDHTVDEIYHCDPATGSNGSVRPLAKIMSAAMLAGLVQHAKGSAIRRDLQAKAERPTGLYAGDFSFGLNRLLEENRHIKHAA